MVQTVNTLASLLESSDDDKSSTSVFCEAESASTGALKNKKKFISTFIGKKKC